MTLAKKFELLEQRPLHEDSLDRCYSHVSYPSHDCNSRALASGGLKTLCSERRPATLAKMVKL